MKYDHTKDSLLEAIGLSDKDLERVTAKLSAISSRKDLTTNSQVIEVIEEYAKEDPMALRFLIMVAGEQGRNGVGKIIDEAVKSGKTAVIIPRDNCSECEHHEDCNLEDEDTDTDCDCIKH